MNPYKVLGVSETASQEEIRAAYLSLVKKYHPDKYADNPLKELADEKLKEINQAYEMLNKKPSGDGGAERAGRSGSYSPYGSASAGGQSRTYTGPNAAELQRARSYINQNNLSAASTILSGISDRNGEWYFLSGIICWRQGRYDKAREYFQNAYQMEPDNAEYRNAYTSINNSGRSYGQNTYGGTVNDCGSGNCGMLPLCLCCDCLTPGCGCC